MNTQRLSWLVWFQFVLTLVIFAGVGFFIGPAGTAGVPAGSAGLLAPVFIGAGGLGTVILFALSPALARSSKGNYLVYMLIRGAFAESVGVYGFVLYLLGASRNLFSVFLVWSLALLILIMPSSADQDRFNDSL